jgi:nesprin-1
VKKVALQAQADVQAAEPKVERSRDAASALRAELPSARVDQQAQQEKRFDTLRSAVDAFVEKVESLAENKGAQSDAIRDFERWLDNSRKCLREFEVLASSAMRQQVPPAKAAELKRLLEDRNNGHGLLERAIEAGENLFAYIAPENRDGIRAHIREMRDNWEAHIDYMNKVQKGVESISSQWASFEENLEQIKQWLSATKARLPPKDAPLCSTLQEKKAQLQAFRSVQQDVASHASLIQALSEKAQPLDNSQVKKAVADCLKEYDTLKERSAKLCAESQNVVTENEEYNVALEKLKDALRAITSDLECASSAYATSMEASSASGEEQIAQLDRILESAKSCQTHVDECSKRLQKSVLKETSAPGQQALKAELAECEAGLKAVDDGARAMKDQMRKAHEQNTKVAQELDKFTEWLEVEESGLKDHSMRNDAQAKKSFLSVIDAKLKDADARSRTLKKLDKDSLESKQMERLADLRARVSKLYSSLLHS